MSKAATTSLCEALEILGFKGMHYCHKNKILHDVALKNFKNNQDLFYNFPRFDFLSEMNGIDPELIPQIDKQYPNSLFILTYRPIESRLRSLKTFLDLKNIELANPLDYENFNYEAECVLYDRIVRFYTEYFKNRNDLLILPYDSKEKWKLLCNFLDVNVPTQEYPKVNIIYPVINKLSMPLHNIFENVLRQNNNRKINIMQVGAHDGKTNDPIYKFIVNNYNHINLLCVEPQPELCVKILNNYDKLKQVLHIFNGCVGDGAKHTSFYRVKPRFWQYYIDCSQWASLSREHIVRHIIGYINPKSIPNFDIDELIENISVPCEAGSYLVNKFLNDKLDILQVDAEGYDDEVIYSCNIPNLRPSVINYEYKNLNTVKDLSLEKYLKEYGYTIAPRDIFNKTAILQQNK